MSLSRTTARWVEQKAGAGGGAQDSQPFEELTGYIPVEAITIFLAVVSIINGLSGLDSPPAWIAGITVIHAYVFCGLAVVPLVVFAVKIAKENKDKVSSGFPWWPIVSGMIAYFAWGMTVPGVSADPAMQIIAAPIAIIVSKVLSLVEGMIR